VNEDDSLLTVQEVSDYMRVGPESIRRWLRDGRLAGVHLGRGAGWRIRRSDLARLVDAGTGGAARQALAKLPLEVEVTCVTREKLQNPHSGVTHLGNTSRRWTRPQVISAIEAGTHSFYARDSADRSEIAVYDGPFGQYLRARKDGQWNDVLLALAECAD